MLETTLVALQDISLDKIFDESGRKGLCADFAKIMQQVFLMKPSLSGYNPYLHRVLDVRSSNHDQTIMIKFSRK